MILATVGTQLPFPRLVDALDAIAGRHDLRIIAQTCEATHARVHLEEHAMMDAETFERLAAEARVIVGHAGIGTILTARRAKKPVLLFPRSAALGEHRNEHQRATVAAIGGRPGIYVAEDEAALERLMLATDLVPLEPGSSAARAALTGAIARFIDA